MRIAVPEAAISSYVLRLTSHGSNRSRPVARLSRQDRRAFEERQDRLRRVRDREEDPVLLPREAVLDGDVELLEQRGEEAADARDHDGLAVDAHLLPRDHLDDLLHRPEAARKSD